MYHAQHSRWFCIGGRFELFCRKCKLRCRGPMNIRRNLFGELQSAGKYALSSDAEVRVGLSLVERLAWVFLTPSLGTRVAFTSSLSIHRFSMHAESSWIISVFYMK